MSLKRTLLEDTVQHDPEPEMYEEWLLSRCVTRDSPTGPLRAMALDVLADWNLARSSPAFRSWLERGAPSDDA
jgi:hypothetical protein